MTTSISTGPASLNGGRLLFPTTAGVACVDVGPGGGALVVMGSR